MLFSFGLVYFSVVRTNNLSSKTKATSPSLYFKELMLIIKEKLKKLEKRVLINYKKEGE